LGGNGKQKSSKLQGAGIPPKPCLMKGRKDERMNELNAVFGKRKHKPRGTDSRSRIT